MEFKDSKDFSLLFFVWAFIKSLEKFIEKRFCTKCWGNNNKLWFSGILHKAIIKVWSTFSKVVGVGKAHKYFPLTQSNNSQTARCLAA
jgi:hypothetical protein